MKTSILGLVALGAQVAFSVPHGGHIKAHGKRIPARNPNRMIPNTAWITATTTVTAITTVTDPAAVVWVDQNNNVLYTEYKDKPTLEPVAPAPPEPPAPEPPAPEPPAPEPPAPEPVAPAPPEPPAPAVVPPSADSAAPANEPPAASRTPPQPEAPAQDRVAPEPANTPAPIENTNTQPLDGSQATGSGGDYGICYDLMGSGNACRSQDQMNQELAFIKSQGYGVARTYDIGCDVGGFVAAAGNAGMKVIVGINLVDNVANDVNALISKINGNWGPIHTVNIGNEVVNNGGSPDAVVAAINTARGILQTAGYNGNVVTVDTFNQHVSYPALCGASDYCAANAHAFFDPQTSAPNAGEFVKNAHQQVGSIANGKRVVITESGWAKQGATQGASVPGVVQQQQAISSIKEAFAGMQDSVYIFQAYDATYKSPGSRGVETSFGVFG